MLLVRCDRNLTFCARLIIRIRRERPRGGRAGEDRDELAPPQVDHATTSQCADHGILSLQ
jgi:hypothetical protein